MIGNQSAGKSTVVERISCISLPKGDGMVTKCPLAMHLRGCKPEEKTYCRIYIDGKSNEKKDIKKEDTASMINTLTDSIMSVADSESRKFGLSHTTIHLEIGDYGLPDLTLYDLPGIYHIDTETQMEIPGLKEYIHKMYSLFIDKPDCAIVCVMAATADLGAEMARGL